MANKRISELIQVTTPEAGDVLPIVNSNETKKITFSDTTTAVRNSNTPLTASGITVGDGNIVPTTSQGATLGTIDKPFRDIFLQSGSISLESDTPGDPSAIISNKNGNLEISIGGMLLVQPGNSFIAETGSFQYISGSLTQLGNYTRFGDTVAIGDFITSGSIEVSGSVSATTYYGDGSNLTGIVHPNVNTGSLMVTGSISGTTLTFEKGDSSTFDIEIPTIAGPSGSQGPKGDTGDQGVQGIQGETGPQGPAGETPDTGSLVSKAYGSFYDTTTQSGSANTTYAVKHNTTDFGSGVSIVSNSRITMAEAGVYTIISTQQFVHTSGGTVTITGWLRKNGTDVPNSATDLQLKGNGAKDLYAINYFVSASAGDYYELMWSANDSNTQLKYTAARTSPIRPAVPSVITTVNKVG